MHRTASIKEGPGLEARFFSRKGILERSEIFSTDKAGFIWSDRGDGSLFGPLTLWMEAYAAKKPIPLPFPLELQGTYFKLAALAALQALPFGETISYQELAARIGSPRAARAIGTVCSSNLYPLLIPCHRVLAAHGKIGGFLGGLDLKKRMLAFEGITDI